MANDIDRDIHVTMGNDVVRDIHITLGDDVVRDIHVTMGDDVDMDIHVTMGNDVVMCTITMHNTIAMNFCCYALLHLLMILLFHHNTLYNCTHKSLKSISNQ